MADFDLLARTANEVGPVHVYAHTHTRTYEKPTASLRRKKPTEALRRKAEYVLLPPARARGAHAPPARVRVSVHNRRYHRRLPYDFPTET